VNATPRYPAWSDRLVLPIDEAQYGLDQGPCLSAIRLHGTFEAADLGTDERWPLRSGPTTVRLSMTLAELRQHFTKSHAAHVLVTTLAGQLIGLVRDEDVPDAISGTGE
jgi:hypothetical protein